MENNKTANALNALDDAIDTIEARISLLESVVALALHRVEDAVGNKPRWNGPDLEHKEASE